MNLPRRNECTVHPRCLCFDSERVQLLTLSTLRRFQGYRYEWTQLFHGSTPYIRTHIWHDDKTKALTELPWQ